MPQLEATTINQVNDFLAANGGVAVVDLYATWCGPCKKIAPFCHKKAEQTKIPLIKIDVDKAPELSQAYDVQAMPTFKVIKGTYNNVIGTIVGGGQTNVNKAFDIAIEHK